MRTRRHKTAAIGAGAALLALASLTSLVPVVAVADASRVAPVTTTVRPLARPTVVSIPKILSLPTTRSKAANKLLVALEFEAGERRERAAAPYALLGGANARGSSVVGSGGALQGFPGVDMAQQASAGTGAYAGTGGGLEPPDQALCVGNGFVMEGVNLAWRIFNTRGVPLTPPIQLSQFFNELPFNTTAGPTSFLSDPKCLYDAQTKRFFATSLQADMPTYPVFRRAHNLIAVSKTSDPTKDWYIYRFDVTDDGQMDTPVHLTCPCIGDQPLIGVDKYGFYISTNEYSDLEIVPIEPPPLTVGALTRAFTLPDFRNGQAQLYAIPKQTLVQGVKGNVVQVDTNEIDRPAAEPGSLWSSLQPAFQPPEDRTSLPANGVEYFLSRAPKVDYSTTPSKNIEVWAWSNTASLATAKPSLTLQHLSLPTSDTYTFPDSASQKDGPRPLANDLCEPQPPCDLERLNANDDRMNQVMLTNGHLWSGLNTMLPPIDPNSEGRESEPRTGIMYFDVRPSMAGGKLTASMARDGYVNVPRESVLFPSIGAAPNGTVVMSFSLSGIDYYPSAAWARLDGLSRGAAPVVHISSPGIAPEDGFTGYCVQGIFDNLLGECTAGKARWGDYSASAVDEHGCIWSGVEYISGIRYLSGAGNWSTFVTRVPMSGCATASLTPREKARPQASLNPCGPLFTSAAGSDNTQVQHAAAPQLDILKGEMRLSPNGKTVTAILTMRELSKDPPPGGMGNGYTMNWTFRGKDYTAQAIVNPNGTVSYSAGSPDDTDFFTPLPDTTGRFNEGPNGTVEIDIPLAGVGKAKRGDIFIQPSGETDDGVFFVDRPASEFDYQVGQPCTASARAAQADNSTQVKGTKQVRAGVLPATGLADTPFSVAGLALIALAAVSMRRLRLLG